MENSQMIVVLKQYQVKLIKSIAFFFITSYVKKKKNKFSRHIEAEHIFVDVLIFSEILAWMFLQKVII